MYVNTNFMGNQSWSKNNDVDVKKTPFFNVKLKLLINFKFSQFQEDIFRSSRTQMFFKIGVLKSFANFRGKHLC